MKDIVQNRQRISLGQKWGMARLALRTNGPLWCLAFGGYYVSSTVADRAFSWMRQLRGEAGLPGLNGREMNKAIWQSWDWSAGGEEWTLSPEWKESLVKCVLNQQMPEGAAVLEIGPGGGRWTGFLIDRSSSYHGVDISESCVEVCRAKFGSNEKAAFHVGTGCDLQMIDDASVDAIWSFDVFVHINRVDVEKYVAEFKRVLQPGGVGVIHHGAIGGEKGGWRSDLTLAQMHQMLEQHGLALVESFREWRDGDTLHPVGLYDDAVTVFRNPDVS